MRKAKTKLVSFYEFFMENKLLSLFLIGLFFIFLWDYKVGLLLVIVLYILLTFIASILIEEDDLDEIFGDFNSSVYFLKKEKYSFWLHYNLFREKSKKQKE
jgi:hypothetical protein